MSLPTFGLSFERVDAESRPAVVADMAVIGLVGTAPAADASRYPLNTPVLIFSDDLAATGELGVTGTLPGAVELINAQLGEFQRSARIVLVRVVQAEAEENTILNLVGSSNAGTGVHALLKAPQLLGVAPRLISVPGYTGFLEEGLESLTLTAPGENLTEPPVVAFAGGGTAPGKIMATAHAVLGDGDDAGKVVSLVIDTPGANLTDAVTVVFTGGGADPDKEMPTATATIGVTANPIVAALPSVLERLLAHAVVTGPATTLAAFTDWRETINSQRIIPLETKVKVGPGAVVQDGAPAILGVACRRDHEKGGRPFHSWANQPVAGIVGPNRAMGFSLTDGATEGQSILALNGGVILRGEAGVESAIATGGFVYVGTDNAGEDDLWRFYNVTRGRDYIHLMFLRTLRFYLGRFNLTGQTIQAVINTMNMALRDLKADGDILDFRVGFTRDQNSPEQLRLGRFTIDFQAEEAPVLRFIGIRSARYRPALDALLDDLLSQIDQSGAAAA
jgi:phage tail sheath protein FI